MNTGVSTVPWASVSLPRRAAPHRAVTWNSIAAIVAAVTRWPNEFGPTNGSSSGGSWVWIHPHRSSSSFVGADSSTRGVRLPWTGTIHARLSVGRNVDSPRAIPTLTRWGDRRRRGLALLYLARAASHRHS